jgi:hypothetical protein
VDLNTQLGGTRRQLGEPNREPVPVLHLDPPPRSIRLEDGPDGEPVISWDFQTRRSPAPPGARRHDWGTLTRPRALRDPREALDRFLKLEGAPPGQVLAFARAFGLLTFTEGGGIRPYSVRRPGPVDLYDLGTTGLKHPVPVSWYHDTAALFRALLLLSVTADKGQGADPAECEIVEPGWTAGVKPGERIPPNFARGFVTRHVNILLSAAAVTPAVVESATESPALFSGGHRRPQLVLRGHGLWGVLVTQLMYMILDIDRHATCSECRMLYPIKGIGRRRPRADRRNYCPECGVNGGYKASNREAARKWRIEHKDRIQKERVEKRRSQRP